jgi:hypothetical protein
VNITHKGKEQTRMPKSAWNFGLDMPSLRMKRRVAVLPTGTNSRVRRNGKWKRKSSRAPQPVASIRHRFV